eukprot:4142894-Prymnesium_polylepis.1
MAGVQRSSSAGVQRTPSQSTWMLDADSPLERAQRLLTRRSLIAFDLDKTVLHQGHKDELHTFTVSICQTLIQLTMQRHNSASRRLDPTIACSAPRLVTTSPELYDRYPC